MGQPNALVIGLGTDAGASRLEPGKIVTSRVNETVMELELASPPGLVR